MTCFCRQRHRGPDWSGCVRLTIRFMEEATWSHFLTVFVVPILRVWHVSAGRDTAVPIGLDAWCGTIASSVTSVWRSSIWRTAPSQFATPRTLIKPYVFRSICYVGVTMNVIAQTLWELFSHWPVLGKWKTRKSVFKRQWGSEDMLPSTRRTAPSRFVTPRTLIKPYVASIIFIGLFCHSKCDFGEIRVNFLW